MASYRMPPALAKQNPVPPELLRIIEALAEAQARADYSARSI